MDMLESDLISQTSFSASYLLSLLVYMLIVTITPGPNNLMVTASGMNFGYQRTLPHIFGIMAGCAVMVSACAAGLGSLFLQFPILHTILKVVGSLYLLWLAYKIFTANSADSDRSVDKPLSFYQAMMFQFVNPKAWMMSITAISTFSLNGDLLLLSLLLIIGLQTALCLPCVSVWALMGVKIREFVRKPVQRIWFNRVLGVLTASCVLMLFQ